MDKDYSPFDHGTQTKEPNDKFYKSPEEIEVLLSDSEKFEPNGCVENITFNCTEDLKT